MTANPGLRNAEFFRWGLQGYGGGRLQELREVIDRGRPVPLGLKGDGRTGDHQVLAIGYDLGSYKGDLRGNESDLRIFVYDPNYPRKTMTLVPDMQRQTYTYRERGALHWRTYFVDKKYAIVDPPAIAAPATTPDDGKARELLIEFGTGGDDLRGRDDNLDLTIHVRNASWQEIKNVNRGRRWIDNYKQTVSVPLKEPIPPCDLSSLTLRTTSRGGVGGDNWNLDSLKVTAVGGGANRELFSDQGRPLNRFTGDRRQFVARFKC